MLTMIRISYSYVGDEKRVASVSCSNLDDAGQSIKKRIWMVSSMYWVGKLDYGSKVSVCADALRKMSRSFLVLSVCCCTQYLVLMLD